MDVSEARSELRKMTKGNLFKLASKQRILRCQIGGQACGFFLYYKGFNFCISEISGQGCQVERSEKLEEHSECVSESNCLLPVMQSTISTERKKRDVEFRVYCRDETTHSMILLGKVTERRTRERGKNLKDLLVKAVRDYSKSAADPSTIFLLIS